MSHDTYDEPLMDVAPEPEKIDNHLREQNQDGVNIPPWNELVQVLQGDVNEATQDFE